MDQIGQLAQLRLPAERVLTGSPARTSADAFVEELFQKHHGEIYAYLVRMLRDSELAADLTQDAFIKAYRAHGSLENPAHARAWLYQIAHRVALDEIRRRKIVRFLPWTGEAYGSAPSAEHLAMGVDPRQRLAVGERHIEPHRARAVLEPAVEQPQQPVASLPGRRRQRHAIGIALRLVDERPLVGVDEGEETTEPFSEPFPEGAPTPSSPSTARTSSRCAALSG